MFIHLISDERKSQVLDMARLLLVFENPVLWDGKNEDELTGETDLGKISLSITEAQANLFQSLVKACDADCTEDDEMDAYLISKIKLLRLTQQNSPADRLAVAKEIIDELANKKAGKRPAAQKASSSRIRKISSIWETHTDTNSSGSSAQLILKYKLLGAFGAINT